MSIISLSTTWSDGQVLTASALNGNFTTIVNDYNGSITNANISASAAISASKLAGSPTFPTGTIVGTTDTQTLSAKTLTNPIVNGSTQATTALSGTSPNIDLTSAANIFTLTMTGSATWTATTNTGKVFMVEVKQGSGTTYTNTWFSGITWVTLGGTAPTQTTTSNGYTTYGFRCTGANTYLGYLVGTN